MNISVVGSSSVVLPAECVVISLAVGFTGSDREQVSRDTADLSDSVRADLVALTADGGGTDAKLSGLRVWTNVAYDEKGRPGESIHTAQVRGSVSVTDLTKVGPFLGQMATTEGVQVEGLDWRLADATTQRVQPEVLAAAFADAQRRAEWIAAAAGGSTLEVESIEDGGSPGFYPRAKMAMAMADGAASFELDPEDVEVSATLNVRFSARLSGK